MSAKGPSKTKKMPRVPRRQPDSDAMLAPSLTSPTLSWSHRPDPPRLSPQVKQEQSNKSAFMEWLQEHEWMPNEPKVDLGEDFLVNIYENQRATGLSLFIQHKSTDNIDKFKLKESNVLSYPVDVPDLLHWQKFAVPVYLVVCDAKNKHLRYYLGIYENLLRGLDTHNPKWFKQDTIQIKIPIENIFDESAFAKIRIELADHFCPIYLKQHKGIDFKLALSFPATPEGVKQKTAFNKFLDGGRPVTLGSDYIKEFQMSEWHERLYGPVKPDSLTFVPKPSKRPIKFRFEVVPDDGSSSASQSINFRVLRSGRREIVLSNETSEAPIVFTLKMTRDDEQAHISMKFKLRHSGNTIFDTREALNFLIATKCGGMAYLIEESTGKSFGSLPITSAPDALASLSAKLKLIDQLCFIQQKLRLSKPFCLKHRKLTPQDYRECNEIYHILKTGYNAQTASVSFSVNIDDKIRSSIQEPIKSTSCLELRQTGKVSSKLFGIQLDLGICQSDARLTSEQTMSFVEQIQHVLRLGHEQAKVEFKEVALNTAYLQWVPKEALPSDIGRLPVPANDESTPTSAI